MSQQPSYPNHQLSGTSFDHREIASSDIMFLASTAMQLVEFSPNDDIYQFVGEQLYKLCENSIIVISSLDEEEGQFCVRAIVGNEADMVTFYELLGVDPVGLKASISEKARFELKKGKLIIVPDGIYEFSFREVAKTICRQIEQQLELGDIYDIGFCCAGHLFGSAAIITRKGRQLTNVTVIETLVNQTAVALRRWQAERKLQLVREDLESKVAQRTEELTKANQALKLEITERKKTEENLKHTTKKLYDSLANIIQAISKIIEIRDPYTAGHQRRVAQLACAIAKLMQLSVDQINGLHLAGIIHDVGKIQVPAEILANPGSLSEAEFSIVKTHPVAGYDILKNIEFPWPIAEIIYQHHERLDGSGYPLGLKGTDMLLEAKILAVADVVEAMSSHRPYRPALGVESALAEIEMHKGTLYDDYVVDACITLFQQGSFTFS
jgi:HD-GYP domain-containing protein (c-di-GMP phosphodiesterase class II)